VRVDVAKSEAADELIATDLAARASRVIPA
jgi:hypothetical protein